MSPQATTIITVVETKDGSSPPSSGLDLLFAAAAAQRQHPKAPGRAVTDCASTISSLSSEAEVDLTRARAPPPSKIFFPEVLMDMLNNNQRFASVISWKHDGKSFVIKSRHEFKEKVLPLYFQSNFDSFLRKMKRWGFEKDNVRRRGDPSIEFSHRYFRRDESGLCLRMRCKSGPGRMTDDSCNIQEDPQEVGRSSSSPGHDDGTCQKVGELVDHLMNQQTTQKLLLEETNRGAALDDTLAALNAAAGRRDHTYSYNQAPISEQLRHMSEAQLLMKVKKRMIVAAKKAQLACKLSEYMASPHHQQERERTIHNTQQDYRHLTQLQRLGRVLDDNSRRGDIIARYYRPTSGSLRTKHSREALRASIFAKRQEFGLSQSQQIICRNEDIATLPQFNGGRRISESGSERSDFYVPTQNDRWIP